MSEPTVFVSGCFDLLHSGHVEFLQQAAQWGRLHVAVGSDATILELKGRYPVCSASERVFMLQALACVETAFISSGHGWLDFAPELRQLHPKYFVVNADGDSAAKRQLCAEFGIEYIVLRRLPACGLSERSSTQLRAYSRIPYRLDLAGGWLDQPFVSQLAPGPVIVLSLEPSAVFAARSGLATSTRATAEQLWGVQLPTHDPATLARILFACENPPGKTEIAGSQDALGILLPGVSRLDYAGDYWPTQIESNLDPSVLQWLERHLYLRWLSQRKSDFHILAETQLSAINAARLAAAAETCWRALRDGHLSDFAHAVTDSFQAQQAMFPRMVTPEVTTAIRQLSTNVLGYKLAGAGGGGYLVAIATSCPDGFEPLRVRYGDD